LSIVINGFEVKLLIQDFINKEFNRKFKEIARNFRQVLLIKILKYLIEF